MADLAGLIDNMPNIVKARQVRVNAPLDGTGVLPGFTRVFSGGTIVAVKLTKRHNPNKEVGAMPRGRQVTRYSIEQGRKGHFNEHGLHFYQAAYPKGFSPNSRKITDARKALHYVRKAFPKTTFLLIRGVVRIDVLDE